MPLTLLLVNCVRFARWVGLKNVSISPLMLFDIVPFYQRKLDGQGSSQLITQIPPLVLWRIQASRGEKRDNDLK